MEGGIPGLANLTTRENILRFVFQASPSTVTTDGVVSPQTRTTVPEGEIEIPELWDTVQSLDQVVAVDYFIPGCPPVPQRIGEVLDLILTGQSLPPVGSVLGAGSKTCCDECPRTKNEKKLKQFFRPFEIEPKPDECLLEQGLVCMGPATRDGCGALCPKANMTCRGCYGPPPHVLDQGAKMVSALSSVLDAHEPEEIEKILDQIADPMGTFYRFSLAHSVLRRVQTS
jgi:F420-non-reducing hydrogenase small subunit